MKMEMTLFMINALNNFIIVDIKLSIAVLKMFNPPLPITLHNIKQNSHKVCIDKIKF